MLNLTNNSSTDRFKWLVEIKMEEFELFSYYIKVANYCDYLI